jgi:hypothetical protein
MAIPMGKAGLAITTPYAYGCLHGQKVGSASLSGHPHLWVPTWPKERLAIPLASPTGETAPPFGLWETFTERDGSFGHPIPTGAYMAKEREGAPPSLTLPTYGRGGPFGHPTPTGGGLHGQRRGWDGPYGHPLRERRPPFGLWERVAAPHRLPSALRGVLWP